MEESSSNNSKRPVRIKDIAQKLGLSVSAVSYALRNSPEVSQATRDKVQKAAKRMGYVPNPAMGALSEYRRLVQSKQGEGFRTLAYVHSYPKKNWRGMGNRLALVEALKERSSELGYQFEVFAAGQTAKEMKACSTVLFNRGIQGVFLAPHLYGSDEGTELHLDWRRFATISVLNEQPSRATHLVMPSWVRNREIMLDQLNKTRVKQVGVYTTSNVDAWTGNIAHTFSPHQNAVGRELRCIPPLVTAEYNYNAFMAWFHTWTPEVVVTNLETVPFWLRDNGIRVPEDVGVVFLDTVQNPERTGIDVQPREVAWTAVNLMNDLIRNQSLGVPEHPYRLTVPGTWQWGETWKGG
jgi:LacI family transcriptional regulator